MLCACYTLSLSIYIFTKLPHPLDFATIEFTQNLLEFFGFLQLVPHTCGWSYLCWRQWLNCPQHQRWYGGGMKVPSSLECTSWQYRVKAYTPY